METFSVLLAICAGSSPVSDEFPAQKPVTRNFDVFFDLRLNEWLSKHSWGWWLDAIAPIMTSQQWNIRTPVSLPYIWTRHILLVSGNRMHAQN